MQHLQQWLAKRRPFSEQIILVVKHQQTDAMQHASSNLVPELQNAYAET